MKATPTFANDLEVACPLNKHYGLIYTVKLVWFADLVENNKPIMVKNDDTI